MSAPRDKLGRPIAVVTGMGVVTSLGAGKRDNWDRLTAGESGIRTVTRFPIDGLKTTMAARRGAAESAAPAERFNACVASTS
jgi:3-oxoacyl-[acyl-carrier-protein] synthase II